MTALSLVNDHSPDPYQLPLSGSRHDATHTRHRPHRAIRRLTPMGATAARPPSNKSAWICSDAIAPRLLRRVLHAAIYVARSAASRHFCPDDSRGEAKLGRASRHVMDRSDSLTTTIRRYLVMSLAPSCRPPVTTRRRRVAIPDLKGSV
jgi:hypothetical protein